MITLGLPRSDIITLRSQINWLNDPDVVRYSEQRHKRHTIGTQLDYIRSFLDHPDNILREVLLGENMIGTISAYVDTKNRIADVGVLIGHGYQGKGYGYEAWRIFCDNLLDRVGMRKIEAGCMSINEPMIKVMKKYGMGEEGRRMSHFMVNGMYSDLVLYGRFR